MLPAILAEWAPGLDTDTLLRVTSGPGMNSAFDLTIWGTIGLRYPRHIVMAPVFSLTCEPPHSIDRTCGWPDIDPDQPASGASCGSQSPFARRGTMRTQYAAWAESGHAGLPNQQRATDNARQLTQTGARTCACSEPKSSSPRT